MNPDKAVLERRRGAPHDDGGQLRWAMPEAGAPLGALADRHDGRI